MDQTELRNRAYRICCEHLGGAWNKISPNDMSFSQISGGMSNLLYCCSLPDSTKKLNDEPTSALIRLYGEDSRNSDMTMQVQIFELLSKKELGPKLYGIFDDGRLEEFLPANSLTSEELMNRDISSIIARKLATVHSLNVPNMDKNNTWILEKFYEWLEFIDNHRKIPMEYARGITRTSTNKIAKKLLSVNFEQEIHFLKRVLEGTRSPIVFSHNDLHQGNILLAKPSDYRSILDKRVILIDFEYCSYNYRAYDIANHFCEWCFEYDTPEYPHFSLYEDRYPSVATQREFIRNYLDQQKKLALAKSCLHGRIVVQNGQTANDNNSIHNRFSRSGNLLCDNNCRHSNGKGNRTIGNLPTQAPVMINDHEIDKVLNEIKPFCMAANMIWTLWCIKSAHSSSIKFGYWEHAWTRWQLYLRLKRLFSGDTGRRNGKTLMNFIPMNRTNTIDIEAER